MIESFGKVVRTTEHYYAKCFKCQKDMVPPGDYWWKEGDEIKYFCSIKCLIEARDEELREIRRGRV